MHISSMEWTAFMTFVIRYERYSSGPNEIKLFFHFYLFKVIFTINEEIYVKTSMLESSKMES